MPSLNFDLWTLLWAHVHMPHMIYLLLSYITIRDFGAWEENDEQQVSLSTLKGLNTI